MFIQAKQGYQRLLLACIFTFAMLMSYSVQAVCKLDPDSYGDQQPNGFIVTKNYGPNPGAIRMPKDIAVGSELYRITAKNNQFYYYRVNCNSNITASNYYIYGRFVGGAAPALSSWQGSSLGTVYKTNVDGVGVVYLIGNNKTPGTKIFSFGDCKSSPASCNTTVDNGQITYVFIKTAELVDGSIDFSSIAKLETVVGGNNSPSDEMVVYRPVLTGNIAFTQATCSLAESSRTVNLGEHKATAFTAATPATAWVDASIRLNNCNYGGAQNYKYNIRMFDWKYLDPGGDTSPTVITVATPNTASATWNLTLSPVNGVGDILDNANGIIAIANSVDSASGVGIQLSTTNTATPTPVKFSPQSMSGVMVSGNNMTMTIPLYARYIKTGTVTGGKANAKVTYLIEYK